MDSKGLTELQGQINQIEAKLKGLASKNLNDTFGFEKSAQELEKLNKALSSSFNSSLGMLDLSKLRSELDKSGVSAKALSQAFKDGGAQGQIAFNNLLGQIGKIDTGIKRSSSTIDKMFNTIANTARWGVVSSVFSAVLNSLHEGVKYVKELDDSMTQIMLVTDYSRQQMNEYAKSANEAAKALGNTTVGVMQGTQVFAQQGFNLQQSGQLAELSIKLANASEQDSATTSDQITALMNAYGLSKDVDKLKGALDSWAKVANVSAADVEELAKASQKAASTAATVDVSLEQLNAQIATIESVTKEAPEQIGNGLKTLYARFSDLQMGETLEDGVTLGTVTSVLNDIGVEVLDAQGQMRGVGDMIEDMMEVWSDLNSTQKASVAQTVAGKYQLGRFEALMNSPEMYDEYAKASMNAEGTLDQMNEKHLDSLEGKAAKLQATLEGLFNSVFKPENFYPAIDALTKFIELINKFVESAGGGQVVLTGLVGLFGRLFSNNMAQLINDRAANARINKIREENAKNVPAVLDQLGYSGDLSADQKQMVEYVQYMQKNQGDMSEKAQQNANKVLNDAINNLNKYEALQDRIKKSAEEINILLGANGSIGGRAYKDANGKWEFLEALEEIQNFDDISVSRLKKDIEENVGKASKVLQDYILKIQESGKAWAESKSEEAAFQQFNELENAIDGARQQLERLKSAISPDAYDELCATIDKAEQEYRELGTEVTDTDERMRKSVLIINDLQEAQRLAINDLGAAGKEGGQRAAARILNLSGELAGAEASKDNSVKMTRGVIDSHEDQIKIRSIIEVASAVQQLTFAWQSFQSLGSLWAKDDVDIGEKLLQTLMNLSMVLPNLITGFEAFGLKNPLEAFKDLSSAKEAVTKANQELNAANEELNQSQEKQTNIANSLTQAHVEEAEAIKETESSQKKLAKVQRQLEEIADLEPDSDDSEYDKRRKKRERKKQGSGSKGKDSDAMAAKAKKLRLQKQEKELLDEIAVSEDKRAAAVDRINDLEKEQTSVIGRVKVAQDSLTVSEKAQIVATELLTEAKAALKAMLVGLAVSAVIGGLTAIWGYMEEQQKKAEEAEQKALEKSNEISQSLKDNMKNYLSLRDEYKKTGVASDEFKDALLDQSEQLGILGADLDIARGRYESLTEEIDKNTIATLKNNASKNASTEKEKSDSLKERIATGLSNNAFQNAGLGTLQTSEQYLYGGTGTSLVTSKTFDENLTVLDMIQKLQDRQAEIDKTPENEMSQELKDELDSIKKILSDESIPELQEANKNKVSSAVQSDILENPEVFKNGSYNDVYKILAEDADLAKENIDELILSNRKLIESEEALYQAQLNVKQAEFSENYTDKNFAEQTVQKFNELVANLSPEEKVDAWDFLDWEHADNSEIEENLKKLEEGGLTKIKLKIDIEDAQESIKDVLEAFKTDAEVGYDQLADVFSEDIVQAFKDASGASNVFNDALTLLSNNSFKTQNDILTLKSALDELDHSVKLDDLIEQTEELPDSFENVTDKVVELADEIEDHSFELTIDIAGDLIDQADGIIEALGDVQDMSKKIGEGFIVAAEDASALEKAFPGILKNYSITADGMIQLDKAIAQGAIDAATADLGATTEAQAEKLNSYAAFADAMADSYMAQAEIFAELAQEEGTTKEEVDQQKAESESKLSKTIESSLIERDKAQKIVADNESKYSKTAGENTANSIGQGAEYGANALAALSQKSAESANNIITQWQAVGYAIARGSAGNAEFPMPVLQGIESSGLGLGEPSISINSVEPGDTIEINGQDYTVNSGEANVDAAKQAQEYQAKALGMRNVAGEARARAASLEASGLKTKNDISDIGAPKESPDKGGGGGGNTPKEKQEKEPKEDKFTPKQKEKIKEQVDLYEKINTQLSRTEKLLARIQQESDRLTGSSARANQNKQIKLLQKEVDLYRQKLDIQLRERNRLKNSLKENYNVEFDSEGYITNYAKVLKQKEKEVNDLVKEYNKAQSKEEQESLEKKIKKAQDDLDKFKKDYTRYDTLHGTEIPETNNQMEEMKNNIEDIRVAAYKTAMEAQESLKELGDRAAHFSAVISDNKLGSPLGNLIENTEKLNNLFSNGKKSATQFYDTLIKKEQERRKKAETQEEKDAIDAQIKFYEDQQKNINKSDNLYAGGAIQAATERVNRALYFLENPNIQNNPFRGNMAALEEELEAATEDLENIIEEAKQLVEDREKYIIDRIKELDEKQQYFIDELKTINEHMEKTMDIFNLAFGEEHYEDMIGAYEQMGATAKASFDEAKNNYNYWKQIWDKMSDKERMEDVGKAAREQIDKWKGAMLDAEKEMLDYWGESFTAKTKKAMQDATKSIFGRSNLGDIEANWERDQNFANRYYDSYQKQSRIEALRLKYMDLLDNAQNASLDTQRKIRDSMNEQVKYLEDQTYLSEYNVKYANAQLEILQKQIALEDARNNKNQMRLRRDSQGNYRYVYSQNKDDVRNKEQDLLQSQMDLYDMSKQNKADVTESAFNLWRTTMEQLQELAERARQGDQEAIAARNELLADYTKQMEAFGDEWGASTDGMIASVEWMANSGIESVEEVANKALIALTTNNQAALQSMGIEGDALLDKVLENAETAESAVTGAVGAMDRAVAEYKEHLTTSGGLVSDITKGYGNIKLSIDEASKATQELIDATKTFKEVIRPEDGVLQGYISQLETLRKNIYDLTNENSAAVLATRKAQEAEQKAKTEALNYKTILDVKNGDKAIEKGATYTLKKGTWVYYGRGGQQKDNEGNKGFYLPQDMLVKISTAQQADYRDPDIIAKFPVSFYAHGDSLTSWGARQKDDDGPSGKTSDHKQHEMWHLDEESFRNAIKMDTGGYTGEWANGSNKNNGRFAMLHQKEMVLNENDTANILEAVQMVRTMTDALKILGNMGAYKGTGYNKLGGDTIKQRVEITAEFPNVSDSNEIEKALLGLADSAYQYSYRER